MDHNLWLLEFNDKNPFQTTSFHYQQNAQIMDHIPFHHPHHPSPSPPPTFTTGVGLGTSLTRQHMRVLPGQQNIPPVVPSWQHFDPHGNPNPTTQPDHPATLHEHEQQIQTYEQQLQAYDQHHLDPHYYYYTGECDDPASPLAPHWYPFSFTCPQEPQTPVLTYSHLHPPLLQNSQSYTLNHAVSNTYTHSHARSRSHSHHQPAVSESPRFQPARPQQQQQQQLHKQQKQHRPPSPHRSPVAPHTTSVFPSSSKPSYVSNKSRRLDANHSASSNASTSRRGGGNTNNNSSGNGNGNGHTNKKPPLACLFCRGRKIACGPPPEGSDNNTCNQCSRRQLVCEYPVESRRGMRRRNKGEDYDDEFFDDSVGAEPTMSTMTVVSAPAPASKKTPANLNTVGTRMTTRTSARRAAMRGIISY